MIHVHIPGVRDMMIEHIVLDYNGTLAVDGVLIEDAASLLRKLSSLVTVHVVTADTFGRARDELDGLPCRLVILPEGSQAAAKARYVDELGSDHTAAIGNGNNDRLMLERAAIGIFVIGGEGGALSACRTADIVCADPMDAFDLVLEPGRISATLRE